MQKITKEQLVDVFKYYDDYLDTLLGLADDKELMYTLLKFRSELRKSSPGWSKESHIGEEIEATTFLKYMELCQKEK